MLYEQQQCTTAVAIKMSPHKGRSEVFIEVLHVPVPQEVTKLQAVKVRVHPFSIQTEFLWTFNFDET